MEQSQVDWVRIQKIAKQVAGKFKLDCDYQGYAIEHLIVKLNKFKEYPGSNFYGWAFTVMNNAMIDEIRRKNREKKWLIFTNHQIDADQDRLDPIAGDKRAEFEYWLPKVEHKLTPSELRIVNIYIEHGNLTDLEIAEKAGIQSAASVRVHVSHIRAKCKSL